MSYKKYTQEEKEDYYMKKFQQMERKNKQLRDSVIASNKIDRIGPIYVVKGAYNCNRLNKVLSSAEYIKNDYKSKYYGKRSTGSSHDEAIKELNADYQKKVAITSRDWTNLKLAERDGKLL